MTEEQVTEGLFTRPGWGKQRYIIASGSVVELSYDGNTTPEQLDNLVANALLLDEIALDAGLIPANQGQGARAVANAETNGLKEKFGVRGENEVFHCISIDIEPKAEGKSKVSFFGNDYKQPRDDYARTSLLLTPEQLQEALAPYYEFQLGTFDKFGTFQVDFYVETYKSKHLNQNGNPYTNVARGGIRALDDAALPELVEAPRKQERPTEPEDIPF